MPLAELLRPFPADEMDCYPVNPIVGNVRNNSPACLERVREARSPPLPTGAIPMGSRLDLYAFPERHVALDVPAGAFSPQPDAHEVRLEGDRKLKKKKETISQWPPLFWASPRGPTRGLWSLVGPSSPRSGNGSVSDTSCGGGIHAVAIGTKRPLRSLAGDAARISRFAVAVRRQPGRLGSPPAMSFGPGVSLPSAVEI